MRALFLFFVPLTMGTPIGEQLGASSPEDIAFLNEMVSNLFSERDGREIESDDEGADISTNLATDEVNEEKSTEGLVQELDPTEIARFNNYMDAIYRRMNAALRAKLMDPMILNLNEKKDAKKKDADKAKHNKDKKSRRQARKDDDDDDDEDDHHVAKRDTEAVEGEEEDDVDRMGVSAEEVKEDGEGRKMKKEKKEKKEKKDKKKVKKKRQEQKSQKKAERKKNKETKKHKKGKSHGAKHNTKKERKGGKNEKKTPLERTKRNKHSKSEKNEKNKEKSVKKEKFDGKTMGSLAGIATLRRFGDVVVMNSDSHKMVKSEFSIGPLQLEVSKTFGHGQSRSVKTAKAVTEQLTGKMVLKVKPDGSAHVRSVFFKKPEKVEVRGSLGDQKKRSDTFLKNSVGKVRPMAAQRILKMARYVLKSPSNVERS